jgi:hypothetical protein
MLTRRGWLIGGGALGFATIIAIGGPAKPLLACGDTDCTTTGTLTVAATFDAISVTATYTHDANANNSAEVYFRWDGGDWHQAYTPFNDTRENVSGPNSNAANRYQFRGSIFGLTAGETYDVKVVYSDSDGIVGTSELTESVTTLSEADVVMSGSTYYVDDGVANGDGSSGSPFNSVNNALSAIGCNSKIIVRAGTHAAFTYSKTCSSSTWVIIEGENRDTTIISEGAAAAANITVNGTYVQMLQLRTAASSDDAINVQANSHHVWLDDLKVNDIATAAVGDCIAHSDDAAVLISGGAHHVYVLNSTLLAPTLDANCTLDPLYDSPGVGIYVGGVMDAQGTFVFKGNTINGGFRDCIGNSPETFAAQFNNSDIYNNTISGCKDDGIQMETANINTRIVGNTVTNTIGYSCFAAATGFVGPQYWVRNYCTLSSSAVAGTAWKLTNMQAGYIFHNTTYTLNNAHDGFAGPGTHQTLRNNIWKTRANCYYGVASTTGTTSDYNLFYRTSGTQLISDWGGTADYDDILGGGSFNASTGQEAHGVEGDPLLDGSLHITSSSPAYNVGVALNNLNTSDSFWPAVGAPDIGAYEVP